MHNREDFSRYRVKRSVSDTFYDAVFWVAIGFCFGIGASKIAQYFGA